MAEPKDAVASPGKPVNITNSDLTFGTVTIKGDGQVNVRTQADVSIKTLIKQAA